MFCSTIFVSGLVNYSMHTEYEETSNPDMPSQFQDTKLIPGIGQFYDNNSGLNIEVSYCHTKSIWKPNLILTGGISRHRISSSEEVFDSFFGEHIDITKIYAEAGIGRYLKASNVKDYIFWYASAGPVFNYYRGETRSDGLKLQFEYDPTITFRIGTGVNLPLKNPYFFTLSMYYDMGNIGRGDLKYYHEGDWMATAEPYGESTINDDQLILSFGITWYYTPGGKK
mgnify:CR=1 FL=1